MQWVGATLTTHGYISSSEWQLWTGMIVSVMPFVWAILRARLNRLIRAATVRVAEEAIVRSPETTPENAAQMVEDRVAAIVKNGVH
jgi:hypothetical protein